MRSWELKIHALDMLSAAKNALLIAFCSLGVALSAYVSLSNGPIFPEVESPKKIGKSITTVRFKIKEGMMSLATIEEERVQQFIQIGWIERDQFGFLNVTDVGKQAFQTMIRKGDQERARKAKILVDH